MEIPARPALFLLVYLVDLPGVSLLIRLFWENGLLAAVQELHDGIRCVPYRTHILFLLTDVFCHTKVPAQTTILAYCFFIDRSSADSGNDGSTSFLLSY